MKRNLSPFWGNILWLAILVLAIGIPLLIYYVTGGEGSPIPSFLLLYIAPVVLLVAFISLEERFRRKTREATKTTIGVMIGVPMLVVVCALGIRLWYMAQGFDDFWGDSYHHWLISRLTMENRWIYSDYKGMNLIWPPVYHYLSAFVMWLFDRQDLIPLHGMNVALGTLSCYLVFSIAKGLYKDTVAGLMAGLILAFNTAHLVFSNLNMMEIWAATSVLLALYCLQKDWKIALCVVAFLATLTRHEMLLYLLMIAAWLWLRKRTWVPAYLASIGLGLVLWSGWAYLATGNPLAGWLEQVRAIRSEYSFLFGGQERLSNLFAFVGVYQKAFPGLILALLGTALSSLSRSVEGKPRTDLSTTMLILSMLALHFLFLSFGFWAGSIAYADERFSMIDLPLLALLMPTWVDLARKLSIPSKGLAAVVAGLVILVAILPFGLAAPKLSKRIYVIAAEKDAGVFLGERLGEQPLNGSKIWCDAPVSIYFSIYHSAGPVDVDSFISSDGIGFVGTPELADTAAQAIKTHNVKYLLHQYVSYNGTYRFFPQLSEGQEFVAKGFRFRPIYTFQGWQTDYGVQPTTVWQITPE